MAPWCYVLSFSAAAMTSWKAKWAWASSGFLSWGKFKV